MTDSACSGMQARWVLDCVVSKHLHVMFVGAQAIWDRLKTSQLVLREIEVDAKKIIMWLVALSVFNNGYNGLRQTFFPDPKSPTAFHSGTFDVASTQAHFDDRLDSIVHGATIADSEVAQELNQAGGAPLHTEQAGTRPTSDEQLALPHVFLDAPIGHRCDQSPEEQTLRGAISARVGVSATCGAEPLSEFSESVTLILGAFPDLCFLGMGVAKCGSVEMCDATTWQALEADKVLAVWEKQGERESIMFEGPSAINRDALLAALPQPGSSGVVGCWIDAVIRGHKSKAKILDFQDSRFKVEFEQWKALARTIRTTASTTFSRRKSVGISRILHRGSSQSALQ